MIISVDKLRQYVETKKINELLEAELLALETSIRKETNNNFQNRNIRFTCNAIDGVLTQSIKYLKSGDTIQISNSKYNAGLYVVETINENSIKLNKELYDEESLLITKVEYPEDVKMGVVEIVRWKLKNEAQNYDPDAEKEVQSETISRHSVTYARDASESNISEKFGVPVKYLSFLKRYYKARS